MPKTIIIFKLFIASPGDVSEERLIVKAVINELNSNPFIEKKGLRLELVGWEDSTYPDIGEDAQDVINTQINDNYDIFLGIFWSRFGTPTKRDSSGTKEEFERAYKKYVLAPDSIHILMYFKDAPIEVSKIDPIQIQHLQSFQKDVRSREKGLFTWTFSKAEAFERLVRNHLSLLLSDLTGVVDKSDKKKAEIHKHDFNLNETANNEIGIFELLAAAGEYLFQMEPEISKITSETRNLEMSFLKATAKLNALQGKSQEYIVKESKEIIDETGDGINAFNSNIDLIIPIINGLFNSSMKNFSKVMIISKHFNLNNSGNAMLLEKLFNLKEGLVSAVDGISGLNEIVKSFPPVTTKLLKARNEANRVMTDLVNEFTSYIYLIDDVLNTAT